MKKRKSVSPVRNVLIRISKAPTAKYMDMSASPFRHLSAYTKSPLVPSCSGESEELCPVMKSVSEFREQPWPSGQQRADGLIERGASQESVTVSVLHSGLVWVANVAQYSHASLNDRNAS